MYGPMRPPNTGPITNKYNTMGEPLDEKKTAIKRLHAIIATTRDGYIKQEIKNAYGVQSTKDMTLGQINEAIEALNRRTGYDPSARERERDQKRIWCSKILGSLQALGITAPEGDFTRVNDVLSSPKVAGKLLYQMDLTELKAAYRRLKMWEKKEDARELLTQQEINKMMYN